MSFINNFISNHLPSAPSPGSEENSSIPDLENQLVVPRSEREPLLSRGATAQNYGATAHLEQVPLEQTTYHRTSSSVRIPPYFHYQLPPRESALELSPRSSASASSGVTVSKVGNFYETSVTPAPTSLERARDTFNQVANESLQHLEPIGQYVMDRAAEKMIAPYQSVSLEASWENAPFILNRNEEVIVIAPDSSGSFNALAHFSPEELEEIRIDFRKALVTFYGEDLVTQYEAPLVEEGQERRLPRFIVSPQVLTAGETASILAELKNAVQALQKEEPTTDLSSLPTAFRVMQPEEAQRRSSSIALPQEVLEIKQFLDHAEQQLRPFRDPVHRWASKRDIKGHEAHLYREDDFTERTIFQLDQSNAIVAQNSIPSDEMNQQVRAHFRNAFLASYGEILTKELLGEVETPEAQSKEPLNIEEVSQKLIHADQAIQEIKSFFQRYPTLDYSPENMSIGEKVGLGKSALKPLAMARRDFEAKAQKDFRELQATSYEDVIQRSRSNLIACCVNILTVTTVGGTFPLLSGVLGMASSLGSNIIELSIGFDLPGALAVGTLSSIYSRPDLAINRIFLATARFQASRQVYMRFYASDQNAIQLFNNAIEKVDSALDRLNSNDPIRTIFEAEKSILMAQRNQIENDQLLLYNQCLLENSELLS